MIDMDNRKTDNGTQSQADQVLRLRADFANYRRRAEEQRAEQIKMASEELIKKLLPVLDDLDKAVKKMPKESEDADWCKGVALVERNLQSVLEKEGISRINTCGCEFDPNEHEAIFIEEGKSDEQGKIKETIRDGYKLHDKVIRPAQVTVVQGIKREAGVPETIKVPVRKGGDTRWMASRSVPNARATYS